MSRWRYTFSVVSQRRGAEAAKDADVARALAQLPPNELAWSASFVAGWDGVHRAVESLLGFGESGVWVSDVRARDMKPDALQKMLDDGWGASLSDYAAKLFGDLAAVGQRFAEGTGGSLVILAECEGPSFGDEEYATRFRD